MANLLLEDIEYLVEDTPRGVWRRYLYPTGARFEEFFATDRARLTDYLNEHLH